MPRRLSPSSGSAAVTASLPRVTVPVVRLYGPCSRRPRCTRIVALADGGAGQVGVPQQLAVAGSPRPRPRWCRRRPPRQRRAARTLRCTSVFRRRRTPLSRWLYQRLTSARSPAGVSIQTRDVGVAHPTATVGDGVGDETPAAPQLAAIAQGAVDARGGRVDSRGCRQASCRRRSSRWWRARQWSARPVAAVVDALPACSVFLLVGAVRAGDTGHQCATAPTRSQPCRSAATRLRNGQAGEHRGLSPSVDGVRPRGDQSLPVRILKQSVNSVRTWSARYPRPTFISC